MGEEKLSRDQNSPYSLSQAIELLSSLISLSHSIKVFTVKWQLIRNKLEELNSCFIAVENCDSSSECSSLFSLVQAILVTVNECYGLARRCVDLSYSGKLLMQSDLDVLLSKFDRHVKNLSGIYTAGVLTQGFAIVVSRPGHNACKDDMRFYIRDLLTRMKIGSTQMKKEALLNLHEVVTEGEKYVKIVVLEVNEIVSITVNFLDDSTDVEIQEAAAKVVSVISGFDLYKIVLIDAGVIGPLIRVLERGNEFGKEAAARSLQKLTENSDHAWSVSAHGGVTALLKICSCAEFRAEVIGSACGVLRNLLGVEEIKRFMVEEGAISIFIKLARSKDEIVQINSIEFIQNIASGDEPIRQMVIRGGIRELVQVLDPKSPFSSKLRETALRAIGKICFSSSNAISILMNCGFMDNLLYFLREGEVSVQELALKVALELCGTTEETKKAMGNSGFMAEFVRLLDAKSFEIREMAAEALHSMVSIPKNRKRFVQDDRNIGFILQLLDKEEANSGNKKFLLSILMSLTSCNSARRKIASSGYLKNIEKLAEAEVSDAKRLVRKLSTNRFRSILSGIWHTS